MPILTKRRPPKKGTAERLTLAHSLRREYQGGSSIRDVARHRRLSYWSTRRLLLEAGTVLRHGWGSHASR